MNTLKNYLDQVTAEEALKNKTKAYVKASLLHEQKNPADKKSLRSVFGMKKLIVAASTIAACAVLAISGYAYSNTAVNFVSLDINPSVELGLNAFDKVVSVEGVNEDGQNLIREQKLTRLTIEEAIRILVEEAVNQNYIAEDGSTVIAVTAESDDENEALQLQESSAQGVNLAMSNKGILSVLYQDCSSLDLRTEAKALDISPGKLKLIKFLQTLDPNITIEEYQNAKVSDIIDDANELLASVDPDNGSDISNIISNIKNTFMNMEQNRQQHMNENNNNVHPGNSNGQSGNNDKGNSQNSIEAQERTQLQDQSFDGTMDQTRDRDRVQERDQSCISDPDDDEANDTEDTGKTENKDINNDNGNSQSSSDNSQQNSGSNGSGKNN